jgi:DNA-binding response OmpR family regulator
MTRILIAEDNPRIASFLEKGLRANGFATVLARNGDDARQLVLEGDFELLILDIGLPARDGLSLLREIRAVGRSLPVLILTGLPDRDVVTCLESGADDYMRKPFRFDELLARAQTQLRPHRGNGCFLLSAGGLELDLRTRRATVRGRSVELTSREFSLLETFLRHPDQVLSREQLLSQVWGYSFDPTTNLVGVYIRALRKKLGADTIETVRGCGYRLPRTEPSGAGPPPGAGHLSELR